MEESTIYWILGGLVLIGIVVTVVVIAFTHSSKGGGGKSCDASHPPANGGAGTCTTKLSDGKTCQPTCNPGYTASGTTSCKNGQLTAATCKKPSTTMYSCDSKTGLCSKDPGGTHSDQSTCNQACNKTGGGGCKVCNRCTTQNACGNLDGCSWDGKKCTKKGSGPSPSTTMYSCNWNTGKCSENPEGVELTNCKATCNKTGGGDCKVCNRCTTQNACGNLDGCSWDGKKCTKKGSGPSPSTTMYSCNWNTGKCSENPEGVELTNCKATCNKTGGGDCKVCNRCTTQNACGNLDGCSWDGSKCTKKGSSPSPTTCTTKAECSGTNVECKGGKCECETGWYPSYDPSDQNSCRWCDGHGSEFDQSNPIIGSSKGCTCQTGFQPTACRVEDGDLCDDKDDLMKYHCIQSSCKKVTSTEDNPYECTDADITVPIKNQSVLNSFKNTPCTGTDWQPLALKCNNDNTGQCLPLWREVMKSPQPADAIKNCNKNPKCKALLQPFIPYSFGSCGTDGSGAKYYCCPLYQGEGQDKCSGCTPML